MITNVAFDPTAVAYEADYENSLHFSPTFAEYERGLAERLIRTYDLRGKRILEIGSGDGEVLTMLCDLGGNTGVGYDPSYSADEPTEISGGRVHFVRDLYTPGSADDEADLVCCRHVLEHDPAPRELVQRSGAALVPAGGVLYFEVPDASYMLEQCSVWDLVYEHPQYFSAPPLVRLFEEEGFEILTVGSTFGGQYLAIEAARTACPRRQNDLRTVPRDWRGRTEDFGNRFTSTVDDWERRLRGLVDSGSRIALWGAGSKGSSFLNLVPTATQIELVVDLNERKHGFHVGGTGHRIVGPDALAGSGVDTVLYANPLYESEIKAPLAALDVDADTIVI